PRPGSQGAGPQAGVAFPSAASALAPAERASPGRAARIPPLALRHAGRGGVPAARAPPRARQPSPGGAARALPFRAEEASGPHPVADQRRGLHAAAPRLHVMKSSWQRLRVPHDPSNPSPAQVLKQMDNNKTAGERSRERGGGADREANLGPKAHLQHPGNFPRAAGAVGAASTPRAAGADLASRARGGGDDDGMVHQWRPRFAKSPDAAAAQPKARSKKAALGSEERPAAEVWGMRIVAGMVLTAVYLQVKDMAFSPTGGLRKQLPRMQMPEQQ
ncbi:unnamed protein product, partial [Prorocentrum cordatum]